MKILLAGASGAIGRRLIDALRQRGHDVIGVTRSAGGKEIVQRLGAQPIVADVLDRDALLTALDGVSADAVIHEVTALKRAPTHYRGRGITVTNELRTAGTSHLLEAAKLLGAKRFVAQSMIFGYGFADHGNVPITEVAPFGRPRGRKSDPATVAAVESGRPGNAYNIVDDQPATWGEVFDAMAHALGAPRPARIPVRLLRLTAPFLADQMITTSMRVSNDKAKTELGWQP